MLEVKDLIAWRSGGFRLSVPAFRVTPGHLVCITGPNGSGKSSFMECLVGLLQPAQGSIMMNDTLVSRNLRMTKAMVGFIPDDEQWFIKELTAREYLDVLQTVYRGAGCTADMPQAVLDMAATLRFTAFDERLERLSHGNKKKVQMIAGLMHQPAYIVIDELRNGLDPSAIIAAEHLIKNQLQRGACVVASTHDLWWAERIADETMVLVNGTVLLHAPTASICTMYGSLEKAYLKLTEIKKP